MFNNKKIKLFIYAITWMNLKVIMQNRKKARQKSTYYIISFI